MQDAQDYRHCRRAARLAGFSAIRYVKWMVEQLAASEAGSARHEHVDWLKLYPVPRSSFDRKLLAFLKLRPHPGLDGSTDGRRTAMRHALDNQASWDSIRHWRRGTRPAPQWATDLLNRKIAERLKELERVLAA